MAVPRARAPFWKPFAQVLLVVAGAAVDRLVPYPSALFYAPAILYAVTWAREGTVLLVTAVSVLLHVLSHWPTSRPAWVQALLAATVLVVIAVLALLQRTRLRAEAEAAAAAPHPGPGRAPGPRDDSPPAGVVRTLTEPAAPNPAAERREHPRLTVPRIPCGFRVLVAGTETLARPPIHVGHVLNVSLGGVGLVSTARLDTSQGCLGEISFSVSDGLFHFDCRFVRATPGAGGWIYGVQFLAVSPDERVRLERCLEGLREQRHAALTGSAHR